MWRVPKHSPRRSRGPGAFKASTPGQWRSAISRRGKDKQDQTPAYELSFRYFENGVTGNLKIDYGSFAIMGELKELTFLDPGKCPASASAH